MQTKIKTILAVIVLGIIFLFPGFIYAASYDLYVDTDKDDDEEEIFENIKDALEEADKGDKILIREGTYSESFTLGKDIELIGESQSKTVIKGSIVMEDGSSLQDLTIKGGSIGVKVEDSADVEIDSCTIKDTSDIGINAKAGNGKVKVKNSTIENCRKGFYIEKGREVEIVNNSVIENKEEGIDIRAKVEGVISGNEINYNGESGIEFIVGSSSLNIKNNNIKKNGSSGITSQFYPDSSKTGKVTINNNKIRDNKKYGFDCGVPQGGRPTANYWSNSIDLTGNTIESNDVKSISDFCDIIDAVEKEDEEKDNIIKDEPKTTPQAAQAQQQQEVEERLKAEQEPVAAPEPIITEAQVEQEENIWEKLEEINEKTDVSNARIDLQMEKIEVKSEASRFFWGPDLDAIEEIEKEIFIMNNFREDLKESLEKTKLPQSQQLIKQGIDELEENITRRIHQVKDQEGKFSLFGWLVKVFKKEKVIVID